jgi:hypothetical protein
MKISVTLKTEPQPGHMSHPWPLQQSLKTESYTSLGKTRTIHNWVHHQCVEGGTAPGVLFSNSCRMLVHTFSWFCWVCSVWPLCIYWWPFLSRMKVFLESLDARELFYGNHNTRRLPLMDRLGVSNRSLGWIWLPVGVAPPALQGHRLVFRLSRLTPSIFQWPLCICKGNRNSQPNK